MYLSTSHCIDQLAMGTPLGRNATFTVVLAGIGALLQEANLHNLLSSPSFSLKIVVLSNFIQFYTCFLWRRIIWSVKLLLEVTYSRSLAYERGQMNFHVTSSSHIPLSTLLTENVKFLNRMSSLWKYFLTYLPGQFIFPFVLWNVPGWYSSLSQRSFAAAVFSSVPLLWNLAGQIRRIPLRYSCNHF